MTTPLHAEIDDLLVTASRSWSDDAVAVDAVQALQRRIREPLRVAVAGMVKAGKSTLLNAMIGERLAPTDAGECTKVVTWYRYAVSPAVTLHPHEGSPRRLPIRRDDGRLVLDLGDTPAEEVAHIDVGWPATGLRSTVLIDTPGIASLSTGVSERTADFLLPNDRPADADAIVYLMRHVHASDLRFLESFRDTAAGSAETVNALAVLSRADEVGAGRIDSMLSARRVARRYEGDADLSSLTLGVMPVAGLLAESARTLRESEFAAFRSLAALERTTRDRLLMSTDRFTRYDEALPLSSEARSHLVDRFGIFGVRLATALVRGGVEDSSALAEQLVEQSGLIEVQGFLRSQFDARATTLKVRGALQALGRLAEARPGPAADQVLRGVERLSTNAHALRELTFLSRARSGALTFSLADTAEASRIVGGEGADVPARLALTEDDDAQSAVSAVASLLEKWRRKSESPLADRATVESARIVVRSLEQLASDLRSVAGGRADVVPPRGPRETPGEGAEQ